MLTKGGRVRQFITGPNGTFNGRVSPDQLLIIFFIDLFYLKAMVHLIYLQNTFIADFPILIHFDLLVVFIQTLANAYGWFLQVSGVKSDMLQR